MHLARIQGQQIPIGHVYVVLREQPVDQGEIDLTPDLGAQRRRSWSLRCEEERQAIVASEKAEGLERRSRFPPLIAEKLLRLVERKDGPRHAQGHLPLQASSLCSVQLLQREPLANL